MSFRNRAPVVDARSAERIGTDANAGRADGVEIDDVREIFDVCAEVIIRVRSIGRQGTGEPDALDAPAAGFENLIRPAGDPSGGVGVGRPAVGRVVLEPAIAGRVVRRG